MTRGKWWARGGFSFGIIASVAANIGHSYVQTSSPPVGAIASSAFWPIALLVTLEIISRIQWPNGIWWFLARYLGLTTVAVIAAIASYIHMSGLLAYYREDSFTVIAGPISVDGLMVVSSVALLAIADNQRRIAADQLAAVDHGLTPNITIPSSMDVNEMEKAVVFGSQDVNENPPAEAPKPNRGGDELKAQAIQWVREYTGDKTLTGEMVGNEFGRSPTWGRATIRQARS